MSNATPLLAVIQRETLLRLESNVVGEKVRGWTRVPETVLSSE